MDIQIISALITGGATVISALITRHFMLKRQKKDSSIRIANNRFTKIKDTTINGDVDIEKNKNLEIENGEFYG